MKHEPDAMVANLRALIAADKASLNLDFNRAAAIDLATHQSGKSVFEAVMAEASISRAARRLGMAQSAVSQAIARLRPILRDELLVTLTS